MNVVNGEGHNFEKTQNYGGIFIYFYASGTRMPSAFLVSGGGVLVSGGGHSAIATTA